MESKMTKKEKEEVKIEEGRPELPTSTQPSLEVLSHNWQPGSPAVDMRYPGTENTAVNVIAQEQAAKEEKEVKEAKPISEAEYERRTKLDVSSPEYINESLDNVKVK